jgi:hypothetical protein
LGDLLKVFLGHSGPLSLVSPLGATRLFICLLPGFSGETTVPVTDDSVKGKLERALRRLAQCFLST